MIRTGSVFAVSLVALVAVGSAQSAPDQTKLLLTKVMPAKNVRLDIQVGNKLRFDANYEELPQPYLSYTIRSAVPKGQRVKLFGWLTCDGFRVKSFSPKFVGSFAHTVRIPSGYLSAGYCILTAGLSRFEHLLETGGAKGRIVVRVFAELR